MTRQFRKLILTCQPLRRVSFRHNRMTLGRTSSEVVVMTEDLQNGQPLKTSYQEVEHTALKTSRRRLKRVIGMALAIFAGLLLTTVAFRVAKPISPIEVAKFVGFTSAERTWLRLEEMSSHLPAAVIASEDGRF